MLSGIWILLIASGAILLMAVGAILLWAVTASVAGLSSNTIGVILIVVGAIGLVTARAALTRRVSDPTVGP